MHCFTLANSNHLDALFFRYAKWDGKTDCSCRLGSLPTPHLSVCTSTSSATDPNTLAASLHRIHIIPWAQYIRRSIASSLQMNKGSSLANTFAILRRSSRWASIPTELYFYNVNVTSSMMHKPFSVSQFELQRKDMERLFLLYQDVSPHLDLEWRVILKSFVVPQLKQFYNHLRRTKAQMNSADVAHALDIFSATLRFVFLKKNVPFGYIRMRQLMPFLILIFFHTPREPL